MVRSILALALLTGLSLGGVHRAAAELCTIDAVPAATLLLPYFEVDFNKFPKVNKAEQTVISLHNVGATPTTAHVTLWSDLSVPTLAFDVFLKGYDVEEINLTELFYTGEIKRLQTSATGGRGFVLGETPSGGIQTVGELIKAHRGEAVDGRCYGVFTGDNRARGYVTIDNVSEASTLFPSDPGYFGSGGVANDINQLRGVVFVKLNKAIQADPLVAIEAGSASSGDYTFYGRYVGWDGSDGREPLGLTWAFQYFTGREPTDVIVWRDSTAVQRPFDCSRLGQSGWYPLGQNQIVAFNDDSDAVELFFDPDQGTAFPAETQKVRIGGRGFDVGSYRSGWIYLNLTLNGDFDRLHQSFVWVRQGLRKRAALYTAMPYYDDSNFGSPSDVSACGDAPSMTLAPIP